MLILLVALLLGLPHPAGVHPDSLSSTAITISGEQAHLLMRCQLLSLLEVIPDLDVDGDGIVVVAEVAALALPIVSYIDGHYGLTVGSDRDLQGGTRLVPVMLGLEHLAPDSEGGRGYRMGAVEIELLYRAPSEIHDLLVDSTLFADTSPGHIDMVQLRWEGRSATYFSLTVDSPHRRSDPQGRGAFGAYLPLGWRHILGGWDHVAFVFVLVLGSRSLRTVLGVITAFTVAHSVTLALATLEVVDVTAFSHLVEALIALSIAYVAADIAVFPERLRARWLEAFAFGLVHGLGFAAFLREALVDEVAKPLALLGFNVGVELGQIPVALVAAGALSLMPRRSAGEAQALAPRGVRRVFAAIVAVAGLAAFVMRL